MTADPKSEIRNPQSAIAGTESVTWSVRLSDKEPWKTWVVAGVALIAAAAGLILMNSIAFAALGVLIILAATTDYWLPVKYRVDAKGCGLKCGLSVSSIEWSNVKRILLDADGAKISPLAESSRLGPFRGVYLRFAGNREQVIEALRGFADKDVRFVDGGTDGGADTGSDPQSCARDQQAEDEGAGDPHA
ncbi:MAG: hypothetical protein WAO58_04965 [Fimbriimonadaceae bacterium]